MSDTTANAPEHEAAPQGTVTPTDLAIVEIKSDLKNGFTELKADHGRLEERIKGLDTGIRGEIKGLDTGIRGEIKGLNTGFSVIKWCLFSVMVPFAVAILGAFVTIALRLFGTI